MELKGFDDLLAFGRMSKQVSVAGHTFALKTLNSHEYAKMNHSIGDNPELSTPEKFELMQRWTLAYAIESVDGKVLTPEQNNELLSASQLAVSNLLYDAYAEMISEQSKLLEDAKKNSSAAVSS